LDGSQIEPGEYRMVHLLAVRLYWPANHELQPIR
jgi:hypothetical protein